MARDTAGRRATRSAVAAASLVGAGAAAALVAWFAIEAAAAPEPAAYADVGDRQTAEIAVAADPGSGGSAGVDAEWASAIAARTGIPQRALHGYGSAELRMAREQPSCGIRWTTLAGIGATESAHGTHGGGALNADGVAQPAIYGPDLLGIDTARIDDTDDGALDGTAEIDRAVGPMQFIPATWATWGSDGDGDGRADPQQIDDAALAAARYLCRYGDLSDPDTWRTAVFAYNHLESYVDQVAATAVAYARGAGG